MTSVHPILRIFATMVLALFLGACASTQKQASTGEMLDDAALTAKVKTALIRDPDTKALQINVDTFKGTVQLSGFVDSPKEKQRAEEIARQTKGVAQVENRLELKGTAGRQGQ